ncbi:hypothetical protein [Floridanema evergladense]|uniref:Uncharacterized protein n=1 Tax=Floridaenema evergladense BLCC-F167 TaxID=3153639 RepID=A0ABV4WW15_9CYAN
MEAPPLGARSEYTDRLNWAIGLAESTQKYQNFLLNYQLSSL